MINAKLVLALGLSAILTTACGGSDSDGGISDVNPILPAGATIITADNATDVAYNAADTFDTVYFAATGFSGSSGGSSVPVEAAPPNPAKAVLNKISETAFSMHKHSGNIVSALSDSIPCDTGSISDNWSETTTSYSGTLTFNSCVFGTMGFNGSIRYSASWNDQTGDHAQSGNGNLTLTYAGESIAIAMNLSQTSINFDYSITIRYSLSGGGYGFLVKTESPLTGIYPADISGGSIIVQGANNTRLRIVITDVCNADVELDTGTGSFTYHGAINTCPD